MKKDLGNLQLWPDLAIPVPFRRFLFFSNYFLLQQLCQLISDKCLEICLQNFTRSSLFFSFTTLCVLLSFPSTFEHLNITISVFLCTNWLKNLNWQHSDLSLFFGCGQLTAGEIKSFAINWLSITGRHNSICEIWIISLGYVKKFISFLLFQKIPTFHVNYLRILGGITVNI